MRLDHDLARDRLKEALSLVELPPPDTLMHLAMVESDLGRLNDAERLFREAAQRARTLGLASLRAGILVNLAIVRLAQSAFDEAEALLGQALALHRENESHLFAAMARGFLGHVYFADGRLEEAEAATRELLTVLDGGFPIVEGHQWGALGMTLALRGRLEESEAAFARAEALLTASESAALLQALDVQRGFLDHATGNRPKVRRRLAAAARTASRSLTTRIIGAQLAALSGEPFAPDAHQALRRVLTMSEDGASFQVGSGKPASLKKRAALRGVLRALVEGARQRPGGAVSAEELIAAGWPNERILPHAANNRLYVAISTLRRLGLADVLLTRTDGYLIDPAAELRVEGMPRAR